MILKNKERYQLIDKETGFNVLDTETGVEYSEIAIILEILNKVSKIEENLKK